MDGNRPIDSKTVIDCLRDYVTPNKQLLVEEILSQRTRKITVVLDNILLSQNASAIVRTCECLGVQDVHTIEDEVAYRPNKDVLKGSLKWITLNRFKRVMDCFESLRSANYKVVGTVPSGNGCSIDEFNLDGKVAVVFGNEMNGISNEVLNNCDEVVSIPMFGFTASYNVSVSAAIILSTLIRRMKVLGYFEGLTVSEKDELRLNWFRKIVRRSNIIEKEFLKSIT